MSYVLSKEERKSLNSVAKNLRPILRAGAKRGIDEVIISKADAELASNQLIKVEFVNSPAKTVKAHAKQLAEKTRSECLGVHGNTAVFFRKHPNIGIESVLD
jgi:RNA-binding protein YhbY